MKNATTNFVKHLENTNTSNNKDHNSNDESKDMDGLIADLIDSLSTSVLDESAVAIDECVQKNDFQALKQLLEKKSIPLYSELENWAPIVKKINSSLDVLLAGTGDKDTCSNDTDFVNWLLQLDLPIPIVDNLIEMVIEYNFDLTNKDDKLWFVKIVADRVVTVGKYDTEQKSMALLNQIVDEYLEDVKTRKLRRELVHNLFKLLRRHMDAQDIYNIIIHKTWDVLFQQEARQYAEKLIEFELKSKETRKSLLSTNDDNNTKLQWKCYHCNSMNHSSMDACLQCQKQFKKGIGINPLLLAKENKSETFGVTKPFGIIRWNCQVCLSYILGRFFYNQCFLCRENF